VDNEYTCCLCGRVHDAADIIEYLSARIKPVYVCLACVKELANIYAYIEDINNGDI